MKKKLKEICEVKQSKTTSLDDDKVWILNLDKIESHTGKILEYEYSKRTELGQSICQFDENTVLYSKLRPYLNKVVLPTKKGFATSELVPLVPKENISRNYLAAFLRSNHFVSLITDKVAGTKMPRVVMKDFFEVEIPVPTLSDQQKIAAHLDKIQSAIDNRKQQLSLLDEAVKSKFVEMFGENPVESGKWKVEKGENLFKFSSGKFLDAELRLEKGIPVYGGNGIAWYTEKPLINYSTIIIGRVGAYCGNVKLVNEPIWITDNALFIKTFKTNDFNLTYLLTLMEMIDFSQYADKVAQPKITQGPLEEQKYAIPPLDLQNQFATFVQKIDKSKSLLKQQIADLQELLDSKMQEYFA